MNVNDIANLFIEPRYLQLYLSDGASGAAILLMQENGMNTLVPIGDWALQNKIFTSSVIN